MKYHKQSYYVPAFNKVKFYPLLASILASFILKRLYIVRLRDNLTGVINGGKVVPLDGCIMSNPGGDSLDFIEYIDINRDQSAGGRAFTSRRNNYEYWATFFHEVAHGYHIRKLHENEIYYDDDVYMQMVQHDAEWRKYMKMLVKQFDDVVKKWK